MEIVMTTMTTLMMVIGSLKLDVGHNQVAALLDGDVIVVVVVF